MNAKALPLKSPESATSSSIPSLKERQTPELVIALVGPVGSGVTKTADILEKILQRDYGYSIVRHKVSEIIESCAHFVDREYDIQNNEFQRVNTLQTIGNELRKQFSFDYLAEKVVEEIAQDRVATDGYKKEKEGVLKPLATRKAHIIDSLKNPAEVKLLREVYGDVFWLVGIFAPERIRRDRLLSKRQGVNEADAAKMMKRDQEEEDEFGQQVAKTIYEADYFVRNDGENTERLKNTVARFLEILFNIKVSTPTRHESAMYSAVSASAKSACLSRQVGAAIYSESGEEIGVGCNDVPKLGGSLYTVEDGYNDHRCFLWGKKICHNDNEKKKMYEEIAKILLGQDGVCDAMATVLTDKELITDEVRDQVIQVLSQERIKKITEELLSKSEIKNLIEFSRSVHAEMEAIISVARSQKAGLVGATIYTTVFPCHNCARHILASGIKEVMYIEPYPKSKAVELHSDAISMDEKDRGKKVICLQYEGIAPKNFVRLFRHGSERKSQGRAVTRDKKDAHPVFPPPLDGFSTRENLIVAKLEEKEEAQRAKTEQNQEETA